MKPVGEKKVVRDSAERKVNITFSPNEEPLYTAKARIFHARHQLSRVFRWRIRHMPRKMYGSTSETVPSTLHEGRNSSNPSGIVSPTLAKKHPGGALEVLDEADAIQMTETNVKLRKTTQDMLEELKEEQKSLREDADAGLNEEVEERDMNHTQKK
ncbi:hypothetical protein BDZ45DRAFT_722081 [Acephala macrosclerotiorum]|nr:hypothetical protein BDZ45DRAFT_722081 [Acephala macrosclerotiorum]